MISVDRGSLLGGRAKKDYSGQRSIWLSNYHVGVGVHVSRTR